MDENKNNSVQFLNDKLTVLKYLQATTPVSNNMQDLALEISCALKLDLVNAFSILQQLRKEYPELIQSTKRKARPKKVKKQLKTKDNFRHLPENEKGIVFVKDRSTKLKPVTLPKVRISSPKPIDLKDTERIDKLEPKWTNGKITPAEQKSYRGSFPE